MDRILTIIIPAYNMEKYLDRCLSSLVVDKELMPLFEVLVINDGSKDKTSVIAHDFEQKYPQTFRTIDKENGHYGSCVNRGLAEARGTFVKILDADDAFSNRFEDYLNFLNNNKIREDADLILSDVLVVNDSGKIVNSFLYSQFNEKSDFSGLTSSDNSNWIIHGITYRTRLLIKMNYIQTEGIHYTDAEWSFKPLIHVRAIYKFANGALYLYTEGREGQSMSQTVRKKNLWMESMVIENLVRYYETSIRIIDNSTAFDFMRNRLLNLIQSLYQINLLAYYEKGDDLSVLRSFDTNLKSYSDELYSITNKYSTKILGLSFSPIKSFRENKKELHTIQSIYRFADGMNNLLLKFKIRIKHTPNAFEGVVDNESSQG